MKQSVNKPEPNPRLNLLISKKLTLHINAYNGANLVTIAVLDIFYKALLWTNSASLTKSSVGIDFS